MTKEMLVIALVAVYLSICLGSWLKLSYYGVRHYKILVSIWGPIYLMVLATNVAWSYIKLKEKEEKTKFSFKTKAICMFKLTILNIQWFPALMGFLAVAILKAEKTKKLVNESAQKRQTRRLFVKKSYELYDDCMNYGCV
nr:MAG TPA: hypothetical protein [Caudoviricetes sp.]